MTTKSKNADKSDDPKPKDAPKPDPKDETPAEPIHQMHQRIEREAVGN